MGQRSLDPTLYEYGIQTEASDIRAHVAPHCRIILAFRTDLAIDLIEHRAYRTAFASQPNVVGPTAEGWIVPVADIPDIRILRWRGHPWWNIFDENASTTHKGESAVWVVKKLLEMGRFPLWGSSKAQNHFQVQIEGTDILLAGAWRIQVKCDYRAGPKSEGGTGNLFLQRSERNPLKRH